jgi:hypothetical protein
VPLPQLLLFTLASGFAAALAGRQELRTSPRPIALTRSFFAYLSYAVLVIVPASVYFYVFHGDWFLLYFVDVSRIPSAIALIGFAALALLGALSFFLGAVLVRNQRELVVGIMIGVAVLGAAAVVFLYVDRLAQVGTHGEFHGNFNLQSFASGPILSGSLAMLAFAIFGLTFLLVRLWQSGRR